METLELFKKIDEDVELQKKFEGVNTPEKFYEIAEENGLTDDFDTMKAVATDMMKKNASIDEKDLSALKEVSSGVDEVVSNICLSTLTSAAVASYIAAYTGSAAAAI